MMLSRVGLFVSVLVLAASIDQAVKLAMAAYLTEVRMVAVAPFFNLRLGYNTGVSFGFLAETFRELPGLLASIKVGIVFAIAVIAVRAKLRIETVALALIAGGAIGNVIDRIRIGAVVDYIDLYYGAWHWPTFNLADVFISIGVALYLAAALLCGKKRAPAP